jgi:hypothetical protein
MRLLIASAVVLLAIALFAGERTVTYYPGTCPDGGVWHLVDADSDKITVGCWDADYTPPEDPPADSDIPSQSKI